MNILCSTSFGRSSAVMAHHLSTHPKYKNDNILFAFANTSKEREETLIFGNELTTKLNIPIQWVEGTYPLIRGKGVGYTKTNFADAKRNGEVFEAMMKKANFTTKTGLPNHATPYCSDRLKKTPLQKFAKDSFNGEPFVTAMGMRFEDMPRRITWAEIEATDKYIYPLLTDFDLPLDQLTIHRMLAKTGIDLGIKSSRGNCDLCPRKSKRNIVETLREGNINTKWWQGMEAEYGDFWFRGSMPIADLIKEAGQNSTLKLFSDDGEGCYCG